MHDMNMDAYIIYNYSCIHNTTTELSVDTLQSYNLQPFPSPYVSAGYTVLDNADVKSSLSTRNLPTLEYHQVDIGDGYSKSTWGTPTY